VNDGYETVSLRGESVSVSRSLRVRAEQLLDDEPGLLFGLSAALEEPARQSLERRVVLAEPLPEVSPIPVGQGASRELLELLGFHPKRTDLGVERLVEVAEDAETAHVEVSPVANRVDSGLEHPVQKAPLAGTGEAAGVHHDAPIRTLPQHVGFEGGSVLHRDHPFGVGAHVVHRVESRPGERERRERPVSGNSLAADGERERAPGVNDSPRKTDDVLQ